jgi:hypothetical protein
MPQLWDFGGQDVFYILYHLFLSEFGVYVVTFSMERLAPRYSIFLNFAKYSIFLLYWCKKYLFLSEFGEFVCRVSFSIFLCRVCFYFVYVITFSMERLAPRFTSTKVRIMMLY